MAVSDLTEEDAKGIIYTLPDGSEIDKGMLVEIVEARMEEILYNVKDQIASSGFGRDSLVAGAWLIGGGAKLRNISKAFSEIIGFDKVRVQKNTLTTVHFAKAAPKNMEDRLLGTISILAKGNQICTSPQAPKEPIKDDFFQNNTVQDTGELTIIHGSSIKNNTTENLDDNQLGDKTVQIVQDDSKKPRKRKGPGIIKKAIKKLSEISKSIVEDD
jgi:cell division ATPase FtsA